jgi:hypothetical protein
MRKESEADHRLTSTAFRKEENDGTPVGYSGRIALRREQGDMQTR